MKVEIVKDIFVAQKKINWKTNMYEMFPLKQTIEMLFVPTKDTILCFPNSTEYIQAIGYFPETKLCRVGVKQKRINLPDKIKGDFKNTEE